MRAGSFSDPSVHTPDLREIDHVVVRWIVDTADLARTVIGLMGQAGSDELLKIYLGRLEEIVQEGRLLWGQLLLVLLEGRELGHQRLASIQSAILENEASSTSFMEIR